MTGKGSITHAPNRRLRWMLVAQLVWLGVVFVMGLWWEMLLLRQAERITQLERMAGVLSPEMAESSWNRTQRMLHWESSVFFVLLLTSSCLLFWLYWRDIRRAKSIQAFFASLTHELRTPLTSIRLQAETIAETVPPGDQNSELVRRLLEDTQRLESQVERTLELARVEGGGPVYMRPLRLKPMVERVAQPWRDTYRDRIQVVNEIGDEAVLADPAAIQVIVKNLIENALRHSKRNPVVLQLRSERDSGQVVLRARDNGEGYEGSLHQLGRLFAKGPASSGAGVGLYLVCVLMQRMEGSAHFNVQAGFETILRFKEGHADG